ncbi:MAG: hypothetical protein F9K47_16320 [Burkholderiales bacterium]|nr:MAG: hypothetical protein F9K47_16320 [Burkholderiales bacterium]
MNARSSAFPNKLSLFLNGLLQPCEFVQQPKGRMFVRLKGGICQVVGLRTSRTKITESAVYFGIWIPEFEQRVARITASTKFESQVRSLLFSHELSPVAPMRNTYWWPTDLGEEHSPLLEAQVRRLVLPYFDTFSDPGAIQSVLDMTNEAQDAPILSRIERRITHAEDDNIKTMSFSSTFARDRVAQALEFLKRLDLPFTHSDGMFWRERQGVIDLLVPNCNMAEGRFLQIHAAVWHQSLMDEGTSHVPGGVSLVASREVCTDGLDRDPMQGLWFLGESSYPALSIDGLEQAVRRHALTWFSSIAGRNDVVASIRPEYQSHFSLGGGI